MVHPVFVVLVVIVVIAELATMVAMFLTLFLVVFHLVPVTIIFVDEVLKDPSVWFVPRLVLGDRSFLFGRRVVDIRRHDGHI